MFPLDQPTAKPGRALPTLGILLGTAATINGVRDFMWANPSPHFYIELFWALPQVGLGLVLILSSLLSLSKRRWLTSVGGVATGLIFAVGVAFYSLYFWALYGNP